MKRLIAGIVIGSAATTIVLFVVACWRTLQQADANALRALAELDPVEPDPQWVNDLYAHLLASTKDNR